MGNIKFNATKFKSKVSALTAATEMQQEIPADGGSSRNYEKVAIYAHVCVCVCKGSVLYEQLCRNVKQIEKQKGQHLKHKYTQSKIRTYIHMYIPTSRQAAFILQIY